MTRNQKIFRKKQRCCHRSTRRHPHDLQMDGAMQLTTMTLIGAVAGFIAAALWLRGSLIEVPDNMDIVALRRISRWNAHAARAAVAAALFTFASFLKMGM